MLHFVEMDGNMSMKHTLMELLMQKEGYHMEILKIKVGGFRNITEATLCFDKITSLVGLNGYGKSNITDAIDFGFDFIHFPRQGKAAMMGSKHLIPILKVNGGKDYSFDIELLIEAKGKNYYANYGFSFAWETDQAPSRIKSEFLRIKSEGKNQKYNTFLTRNELSALYRTSETGRCSKSIKIENDALVLNKLQAIDDLFYADIIQQLNECQIFIERHLDAGPSFVPAPFVIKGFQELELEGIQSIPRAIYFLKKEHKDKYELLINAFKQLFPDILKVNVKEIKLNQDGKMKTAEDSPIIFTNSIYSMSIVDDKLLQPIGFEHLSDGTKRLFLMLTYAVIADIKNLSMIVIEEPENSIHPSLFQE